MIIEDVLYKERKKYKYVERKKDNCFKKDKKLIIYNI